MEDKMFLRQLYAVQRNDIMKNAMHGYEVGIDRILTDSQHPDEPFEGDWHDTYENKFGFIEIENEYPDIVSVEDFKPGDVVHVVWCEWSSGDSFGYSDNSDVEAIAVFSNYDDAVGLQKSIEDSHDNDKYSYSFVASTGQKFERGNLPWNGYFENLESVNITSTTIREKLNVKN